MATIQHEYDRKHLDERNEYKASTKAILFDSSRCSGCKACMVACKTWNQLPSPTATNSQPWYASLQCPYDLGSNTRLTITFREMESTNPGRPIDWAIGRRACMHCTDAACVTVCPTGALFYDEETGMVSHNAEKCIGCSYCRGACPFDVPRHTGSDDLSGVNIRINKCTGCVDRIKHGMDPACVTTCQPGALTFGDRDEMIAIAEKRVEVLKAKGFDKARVYGATEMGGTHVIYVLKYDIAGYELPENPGISWMTTASEIMKPVLGIGFIALIAGLGGCLLSGVGYKRDELRYDEVNHDVINVETGEVVKHIDKEAGER
ncbi:MAG: 4Fe-4S dicluster domain-containing protein [Coriobacteriaceae bacterium]|jgi:formate dehydrogenase iron-sulfur subunit|nr:4Fe-4S dicluster domain-containing protein [Coriobacteriaceae bacterium]